MSNMTVNEGHKTTNGLLRYFDFTRQTLGDRHAQRTFIVFVCLCRV